MAHLVHLPVVGRGPVADDFQRTVEYLRVSLTERCNYRCTYCMPAEGITLGGRDELLSFEEIERIVTLFATRGVRRVRLTGGEPTVRKGVVDLVARLARVQGIEEVVMTTNGHLLEEHAAPLARAGLAGINVSIDSLRAERFARITRRGNLDRVTRGIAAAARHLGSVKLNCVALAGFNDDELGEICQYAWNTGVVPRFIEWMPMSGGALYAPGALMPAAAIRSRVAEHTGHEVVALPAAGAVRGPARYYRAGDNRFGIISAMSENFCDTCNRLRLSATGQLHACLAYDDATNLRRVLRSGGDDDELSAAIDAAVQGKREGHEFTRSGCGGPTKHMVSIGG